METSIRDSIPDRTSITMPTDNIFIRRVPINSDVLTKWEDCLSAVDLIDIMWIEDVLIDCWIDVIIITNVCVVEVMIKITFNMISYFISDHRSELNRFPHHISTIIRQEIYFIK